MPVSQAKSARPIKDRTSHVAGERSQEHSAQRNIYEELTNVLDVFLSVDLVMYISISEVLVKTGLSNANLQNFCQFFSRQNLEVKKFGSSAIRPLLPNLYNDHNQCLCQAVPLQE